MGTFYVNTYLHITKTNVKTIIFYKTKRYSIMLFNDTINSHTANKFQKNLELMSSFPFAKAYTFLHLQASVG
jgi:hypothetical protein